jgi:hypothetical protein
MDPEIRKQMEDSMLSIEELDILSSMMSIFIHAAEKCATLIENDAEKKILLSKAYMLYRLKRGDKAEEIVKRALDKISYKRSELGNIINSIKAFKNMMDKYTVRVLKNNKNGMEKGLDSLMEDVRYLCKLYAIIGNCETDADLIKVESTARMIAKGNKVSERIINGF